MDLFSDLQAALQSDLTITGISTLFDLNTIKLAINRAYRKCAGMYKWPGTRDALKTPAKAGYETYDYPQNWRPDSIWKVRVDGVDMGDPLTLKDYLYEQENNFPAGNKSIWANQNARYLITVNGTPPIADGDNNIEIWGFKFVNKLVADSDTTIFSYDMGECNEAVVLEALSILRTKGGEQPIRLARYVQGALLLSMEAQQILTTAWGKIAQENAKMEKTTPLLNIKDMFSSGVNKRNGLKYQIGNF